MANKGVFPCKNCDDRKVGCHGSCDKYKNAKATYNKQISEERYQKDRRGDIIGFEIESLDKAKKRCNGKWSHYGA